MLEVSQWIAQVPTPLKEKSAKTRKLMACHPHFLVSFVWTFTFKSQLPDQMPYYVDSTADSSFQGCHSHSRIRQLHSQTRWPATRTPKEHAPCGVAAGRGLYPLDFAKTSSWAKSSVTRQGDSMAWSCQGLSHIVNPPLGCKILSIIDRIVEFYVYVPVSSSWYLEPNPPWYVIFVGFQLCLN